MKVTMTFDTITVKQLDNLQACCLYMQSCLNNKAIVFRDGNFYIRSMLDCFKINYDEYISGWERYCLRYCPYCGEKIEGIEE